MVKRAASREALARIAVQTMHIMQVDACGIWLKNKKGDLKPQVYYGIDAKCATSLFSRENLNVLGYVLEIRSSSQIFNLNRHDGKSFKAFMKQKGLKSFLACPVYERGKNIGIIAVFTKNKYRKFTQTEKILFSTLADEIAFAVRNEDLSNRVKADYLNTIKAIAHILEANDKYTYGHSNKVMRHTIAICRKMKFKKKELYLIKNAALLHDIGKVGIDNRILGKKGRLTVYEWKEIKKHPMLGAEIVKHTRFLNDLAPIIEYHHKRYDGQGYPDSGLKGEDIPIGARIIAIADAYDAMTSERPYRKRPLTAEMALSEIERNAGKQFDPVLTKLFRDHVIGKQSF
ncbi:MAG: HD domain-containing protein [Candidatus Omnitrophota bacterium]|nr:MAG: HD domain-containing protein [Candidatus Omnitrophota bacterium]